MTFPRTFLAAGALAVLAMLGAATRPVHSGPLDASLAPFPPLRAPMPNYVGVRYYKFFPAANGINVEKAGSSAALNQWFNVADFHLKPVAFGRRWYNGEVATFRATVIDEGAQIVKLRESTTRDALMAFNQRYSGKLVEKLDEYRKKRIERAKADLGVAEAMKLVEAEVDQVGADSAVVRTAKAETELKDVTTQRQQILVKAKSSSWFPKVVSFAKTMKEMLKATSPTALLGVGIDLASSNAEEVMTLFVTEAYREELARLDEREEAITKAIAEAKDDAIKLRLSAAQKRLEAARIKLLQRGLERLVLAGTERMAISELALLEESDKQGMKLFQELSRYNSQLITQGRDLQRKGNDYLQTLDKSVFGRTPGILAWIDHDIKLVRDRRSGDNGEWLTVADETRNYFSKHADWYRMEHKMVADQLEAIGAGKHLALVDETVLGTLDKLGIR
ncbi:MAG: hypothetical protein HOP12_07035 [Candidatus Eisenbacteria bacterium]|uniref:DUF5667 domain-containing protein n=1 Tax=Eiseniibacteriota bacterium TaxID=2212470 RepID=A0A849SDW4_UNCEI|nr:hypothetical protein [Candidatus Eisenbacteria bacterium]